jgi:hypothetical protein
MQIPPWSKQTLRCSPNCYRATLYGLFGALSVILSADVRRFLRVGVKVTLAMQLAFTERPAPPIGQLWVCAKFAVFPLAMVMPEMIRFDPLYLKRPLLYVMLITVGRVVLQVSNADKFVAERLPRVLRLPNRKGCR